AADEARIAALGNQAVSGDRARHAPVSQGIASGGRQRSGPSAARLRTRRPSDMGACGQAGAPTPRKAQVMNMKRGGPLHVNGGSEISLSVTGGVGGVADGTRASLPWSGVSI